MFIMVNKRSIVGCYTNYSCHEKCTFFPFPEEKEQGKKWLLFANRQSPSDKNDRPPTAQVLCTSRFLEVLDYSTRRWLDVVASIKPRHSKDQLTQQQNYLASMVIS